MTRSLSFLPSLSSAARSSALTLISWRNWTNFSLFVPIWSRYCWNVIPCANRSFVTMWRRLLSAHRGEIDREPAHVAAVDVADDQEHARPPGDVAGRTAVDAARQVGAILQARGGALVLDQRGLDPAGPHGALPTTTRLKDTGSKYFAATPWTSAVVTLPTRSL